MAKSDPLLSKIRQICLALPETKETMTWGKPHFRVGDKIFAGYSNENGKTAIGFKLESAHAETILLDVRFSREQAVGYKGWISMEVGVLTNWEEVRPLIHESYRLIAPKAKPPAVEKVVAKNATPEAAKPKAVLTKAVLSKAATAKASSAKSMSAKSAGSKRGASKAVASKAPTSKASTSARPRSAKVTAAKVTSAKKTAVKKSR
ncbi:MAG: MmcQ/YjbR family DNA-binding protein [Planctomycetota bacterium]